jgi:hypothetical protein
MPTASQNRIAKTKRREAGLNANQTKKHITVAELLLCDEKRGGKAFKFASKVRLGAVSL